MRKLNRYDFLAPYYDKLAAAVFGQSIWNSQSEFIHVIPDDARILILGGGTGKMAEVLLTEKRACTIWYVEASSAMINLARRRIDDSPRVIFIHGTEENIPDVEYDTIVTGFFIDLFSEPDVGRIITSLRPRMCPEAMWLVTDFVNEKWWHRLFLPVMYTFFRIATGIAVSTLPEWEQLFSQHMERVAERSYYGGFIKTVLYRL